jgi:hypothetical protein
MIVAIPSALVIPTWETVSDEICARCVVVVPLPDRDDVAERRPR